MRCGGCCNITRCTRATFRQVVSTMPPCARLPSVSAYSTTQAVWWHRMCRFERFFWKPQTMQTWQVLTRSRACLAVMVLAAAAAAAATASPIAMVMLMRRAWAMESISMVVMCLVSTRLLLRVRWEARLEQQ